MKLNNDDTGQMLLATGVVLMMSLLSMAIFSVKIAGLTIASDTTQSEVVKIAEEIDDEIFQLVSFRASEWYDAGLNETESVALSMDSLHRDIVHHGEIRGIEMKILNIQVSENAGVVSVQCELGIADDHAMLVRPVELSIDLDN